MGPRNEEAGAAGQGLGFGDRRDDRDLQVPRLPQAVHPASPEGCRRRRDPASTAARNAANGPSKSTRPKGLSCSTDGRVGVLLLRESSDVPPSVRRKGAGPQPIWCGGLEREPSPPAARRVTSEVERAILFAASLVVLIAPAQGCSVADEPPWPMKIPVLVVKYFPVKGDRIDLAVTGDWDAPLEETRTKTDQPDKSRDPGTPRGLPVSRLQGCAGPAKPRLRSAG